MVDGLVFPLQSHGTHGGQFPRRLQPRINQEPRASEGRPLLQKTPKYIYVYFCQQFIPQLKVTIKMTGSLTAKRDRFRCYNVCFSNIQSSQNMTGDD